MRVGAWLVLGFWQINIPGVLLNGMPGLRTHKHMVIQGGKVGHSGGLLFIKIDDVFMLSMY